MTPDELIPDMKKIYLFHESIWKCFEGELPVKPELVGHYSKTGRYYASDLKKYDQAIATLKASALPVGNPEILSGRPPFYGIEGEFYEWPGTVEQKTIETLDIVKEKYIEGFKTFYILHLPKPDMTKEQRLANSMDIETLSRIDEPSAYVSREEHERILNHLAIEIKANETIRKENQELKKEIAWLEEQYKNKAH